MQKYCNYLTNNALKRYQIQNKKKGYAIVV